MLNFLRPVRPCLCWNTTGMSNHRPGPSRSIAMVSLYESEPSIFRGSFFFRDRQCVHPSRPDDAWRLSVTTITHLGSGRQSHGVAFKDSRAMPRNRALVTVSATRHQLYVPWSRKRSLESSHDDQENDVTARMLCLLLSQAYVLLCQRLQL
jgi:hypothetical protein